MIELKSFDSFLTEAVEPHEEETLLSKGKEIASIVEEITSLQKKVSDLYDKLKEVVSGDNALEPVVKAAAAKAKEETKDIIDFGDKVEKIKKDYVPRPGTAAAAILEYLGEDKEATEPQLIRMFGQGSPFRQDKDHPRWNSVTISTTISFLVEKGKLTRERKRNPESNRMAYFYSVKK